MTPYKVRSPITLFIGLCHQSRWLINIARATAEGALNETNLLLLPGVLHRCQAQGVRIATVLKEAI